MKILTRKKQDQILKHLAAISIIGAESGMSTEFIDKHVDNVGDIAVIVDGVNGMWKVHELYARWIADKYKE